MNAFRPYQSVFILNLRSWQSVVFIIHVLRFATHMSRTIAQPPIRQPTNHQSTQPSPFPFSHPTCITPLLQHHFVCLLRPRACSDRCTRFDSHLVAAVFSVSKHALRHVLHSFFVLSSMALAMKSSSFCHSRVSDVAVTSVQRIPPIRS
jgi:hypothetical protein